MKALKAVVVLAVVATLCVAQDRSACGTGQACLTEVPSGAIDGKNCQFSLSRVANPRIPIQVYRNGVRLEPGEDYEASANTITFTSPAAPASGDLLEVLYQPMPGALPTANRNTRSTQSAGGEEISSALARQALSAELNHVSAPEPSTGQTDATLPRSSADTDLPAPSRSTAARTKKSKRESSKGSKSVSAQAIDGFGDNSLESDSTDVDHSDSASTKGGFHSALQLLERRLKPQRSLPDSDDTLQQPNVNSSK